MKITDSKQLKKQNIAAIVSKRGTLAAKKKKMIS